jgi:hypothetical protein
MTRTSSSSREDSVATTPNRYRKDDCRLYNDITTSNNTPLNIDDMDAWTCQPHEDDKAAST